MYKSLVLIFSKLTGKSVATLCIYIHCKASIKSVVELFIQIVSQNFLISWTGRFWGRTYCTEDSSGNFSCITGDCGSGKLECSGSGGAPPATLAEFMLGGFNGDLYYVSLVDGFNLPLLVVPSVQNCSRTGCSGDVNESCPTELQVTTGQGKRVGCKGVCDALGWSIYCCNGFSRDKCKGSLYPNFYKNLCPQSYIYAYDDDTNTTYTCPSTDYRIIFCPGKSINTTSYRPNPKRNTTGVTANNSRPSSGEIPPRRKWGPIIAGAVGGVLAIISFVVIVVLRVRWSKSEDTEDVEEDDHIQQVPGMPVRFSYRDLCIATDDFKETVWPGVYSDSASALSTTGFSLEKNESKILKAPASWYGRFWGRTYCTEDSSGNFSCITGDCGSGKLECSGRYGAPPATLAEFGLNMSNDLYDVSVVHGFNLPLLVVPSTQTCSSTGCIGDVNKSCPTELQVTTGTEEKRVGCKSACDALGSSIYCCNGTRSSPDKCKPSLYSNFFKNLCPQSYC